MNALALPRAVPIGPSFGSKRSVHLLERNMIAYRRAWMYVLTGTLEPVFYLMSLGVGLSRLVPHVVGPGGAPVTYASFVAPGLLATAAMQGAIADATFTVFHKLKYGGVYDTILVTPLAVGDIALGEIAWALLRGVLYSVAFLVVALCFGTVHSWWAVLAVVAAALVGFAFAAVGLAVTTYMQSWLDFEWVNLAMMPMFLFSTTFFPLSVYPRAIQVAVECTPLYQGIELIRALTLGDVGWPALVAVVYLALFGLIGLVIAKVRLQRLLVD